ncbi:MerR family transcriptional regulator, partial [Micromonospora sp. NPDC007271]|uniref:MerR family transcriptional regulator n=1 Tax=Micromonospora sp. NPDC007271 TaxID=3154587 RepID=UPI0033E09216
MRIGELVRVTGCTPRALRHYEEQGLIASARTANGYREYDEASVVRVRNIRHLLGLGLTLEDVHVFLPWLNGDVAAPSPSPPPAILHLLPGQVRHPTHVSDTNCKIAEGGGGGGRPDLVGLQEVALWRTGAIG